MVMKMLKIDLLKCFKLHNVESSLVMGEHLSECNDDEIVDICFEPEIQVQAGVDTAMIVLRFKVYVKGMLTDYINIPVFVFRHDGSLKMSHSKDDELHHIRIQPPYIEYQYCYNTRYNFPIEDLIFCNKYVFGVYWKDYIEEVDNVG